MVRENQPQRREGHGANWYCSRYVTWGNIGHRFQRSNPKRVRSRRTKMGRTCNTLASRNAALRRRYQNYELRTHRLTRYRLPNLQASDILYNNIYKATRNIYHLLWIVRNEFLYITFRERFRFYFLFSTHRSVQDICKFITIMIQSSWIILEAMR